MNEILKNHLGKSQQKNNKIQLSTHRISSETKHCYEFFLNLCFI